MNVITRTVKFNKPVVTNIFYQSSKLLHAYELPGNKKYTKVYDKKPDEKLTLWQRAKKGYSQLKTESNLYIKEKKESLLNSPDLGIIEQEVNVVWRFNGDPKSLDSWITVCDSDFNEGYSTCNMELTQQGTLLFSGNLDYRVPKDGKVMRSGYCALKTTPFRKSFKRKTYLNWENYNHLVMRIRGDGRNYLINIGNSGFFDLTWKDLYNYTLFTRGGPHWQYVKISFSKFFFTSYGRIQDQQKAISLDSISSFGITAADQIPGPFSLEIDYIGVLQDSAETENFAYELYNYDKIAF